MGFVIIVCGPYEPRLIQLLIKIFVSNTSLQLQNNLLRMKNICNVLKCFYFFKYFISQTNTLFTSLIYNASNIYQYQIYVSYIPWGAFHWLNRGRSLLVDSLYLPARILSDMLDRSLKVTSCTKLETLY